MFSDRTHDLDPGPTLPHSAWLSVGSDSGVSVLVWPGNRPLGTSHLCHVVLARPGQAGRLCCTPTIMAAPLTSSLLAPSSVKMPLSFHRKTSLWPTSPLPQTPLTVFRHEESSVHRVSGGVQGPLGQLKLAFHGPVSLRSLWSLLCTAST